MSEQDDIFLKKVINKNGARTQIIKAIEEAGELIQILAKYLNESETERTVSLDRIKKEIADNKQLNRQLNRQLEHIFGEVDGMVDKILDNLSRDFEIPRLNVL